AGAVSASGTFILRINTTPHAVDQTINVGGQQVVIRFGANEVKPAGGSPFFSLSGASLDLTIGNFVTIQGSFSFSNTTITVNGTSTQVPSFAGDGISLFVGQGPLKNADGTTNPNAVGVLLSNAQIGLLNFGSGKFALFASGSIAFVGLDGL